MSNKNTNCKNCKTTVGDVYCIRFCKAYKTGIKIKEKGVN